MRAPQPSSVNLGNLFADVACFGSAEVLTPDIISVKAEALFTSTEPLKG
jgi:hypothetical protein